MLPILTHLRCSPATARNAPRRFPPARPSPHPPREPPSEVPRRPRARPRQQPPSSETFRAIMPTVKITLRRLKSARNASTGSILVAFRAERERASASAGIIPAAHYDCQDVSVRCTGFPARARRRHRRHDKPGDRVAPCLSRLPAGTVSIVLQSGIRGLVRLKSGPHVRGSLSRLIPLADHPFGSVPLCQNNTLDIFRRATLCIRTWCTTSCRKWASAMASPTFACSA